MTPALVPLWVVGRNGLAIFGRLGDLEDEVVPEHSRMRSSIINVGVAQLDRLVVLPQSTDLVMKLHWCARDFSSHRDVEVSRDQFYNGFLLFSGSCLAA